jgi:hypothetical protein
MTEPDAIASAGCWTVARRVTLALGSRGIGASARAARRGGGHQGITPPSRVMNAPVM